MAHHILGSLGRYVSGRHRPVLPAARLNRCPGTAWADLSNDWFQSVVRALVGPPGVDTGEATPAAASKYGGVTTATVDSNFLAGDVAGTVGDEPRDDTGNILRCAHSTERVGARQPV